jgi:hypothetical protein
MYIIINQTHPKLPEVGYHFCLNAFFCIEAKPAVLFTVRDKDHSSAVFGRVNSASITELLSI